MNDEYGRFFNCQASHLCEHLSPSLFPISSHPGAVLRDVMDLDPLLHRSEDAALSLHQLNDARVEGNKCQSLIFASREETLRERRARQFAHRLISFAAAKETPALIS